MSNFQNTLKTYSQLTLSQTIVPSYQSKDRVSRRNVQRAKAAKETFYYMAKPKISEGSTDPMAFKVRHTNFKVKHTSNAGVSFNKYGLENDILERIYWSKLIVEPKALCRLQEEDVRIRTERYGRCRENH